VGVVLMVVELEAAEIKMSNTSKTKQGADSIYQR
jgi:hypothetical protein